MAVCRVADQRRFDWLRLPSILAGACAIPVMAHLGARHSRAAAIVAAALTAGSFFQFTYSVEARGYATATLALIVAFAALERGLDSPSGGARWVLAAAAGLGFFSHWRWRRRSSCSARRDWRRTGVGGAMRLAASRRPRGYSGPPASP